MKNYIANCGYTMKYSNAIHYSLFLFLSFFNMVVTIQPHHAFPHQILLNPLALNTSNTLHNLLLGEGKYA